AAPAFRGLAYIVFEDLPLADYGNRIPQLSFEVEKSLARDEPTALENALTAITVIPSSGEFVYGTTPVRRDAGDGETVSENQHASGAETDFITSIDNLEAAAGNLSAVSLVVAWFGDDLRAGSCSLRPGVETVDKVTTPYDWSAGSVDRATAYQISAPDGQPSYGGTPSDRAVRESIVDLNARGLEVMFHPFVLMDIPPGNGKSDPYGGTEQASFPWRGRITSSGDKSAAATSDVAAFIGSATVSDFQILNGDVVYSGPSEWSFRRFILHYAYLCKAAGGVESFILGSELRGLTTLRDASNAYPMVTALKSLAQDVRTVLGASTKISYGADWSEYFGHQPSDGSNDVFFHLDPLWADSAIDFVGIDNYLPLSDWRDTADHLDKSISEAGPYDRAYLEGNIAGGERYDWYYASTEDRNHQVRTPIVDGGHNEDWLFRAKDFWGWWSNPHHDRPAGVRSVTATGWVPMSKPIRFTEIGAPAINKAGNQPNVFYDPKSAESALPYYSTGHRDDLAQRRFLEAHFNYWKQAGNNPISSVYGGSMVDANRLYVYAWDARPYPFFPALDAVWADGPNWSRGHWLNGRLGTAPLAELVGALATEAGNVEIRTNSLEGTVSGYVLDRPMSPRASLEPLAEVFQFDMVDTAGTLSFVPRGRGTITVLPEDAIAVGDDEPEITRRREHLSDAPSALRLGFLDDGDEYRPGVVEALEPGRVDIQEAAIDVPIVLQSATATERANALLAESHVGIETISFKMPNSDLELEPGDLVQFLPAGAATSPNSQEPAYRLTSILDGPDRRAEAVRIAPSMMVPEQGVEDASSNFVVTPPQIYGAPWVTYFDPPYLDDGADEASIRTAGFASPWPGRLAVYTESSGVETLSTLIEARATIGRLETAMSSAGSDGSGRWRDESIRVRLKNGSFTSKTEEEVLAGANVLLVQTVGGGDAGDGSGTCEVLQFQNAVLGADGVWTLSTLLRGQLGTEIEALSGAPAGAIVALVDPALEVLSIPTDLNAQGVTLKAGPATVPTSTTSLFTSQSFTSGFRALRPLAPVHLRSEKTGDGFLFSWVRRTRTGGDGWGVEEPPLGEAYERYRLTISKGSEVLRTEDLATPAFTYDATKVSSDFGAGGPDQPFTVEVRQLSDRIGPGIPEATTVSP
ncbi:MAG: glycoside hydrolase/phage tail family protein, partial [Pseudomonadota bacterium]